MACFISFISSAMVFLLFSLLLVHLLTLSLITGLSPLAIAAADSFSALSPVLFEESLVAFYRMTQSFAAIEKAD